MKRAIPPPKKEACKVSIKLYNVHSLYNSKLVNTPKPDTRRRAYDEVRLVPKSKHYKVLYITGTLQRTTQHRKGFTW